MAKVPIKERQRRVSEGLKLAWQRRKVEGSKPSRSPHVGRQRQPQAKEVRNTLTGKMGSRLEQLALSAGYDTPDKFAAAVGKTEEAIRHWYRGTRAPKLDEWPKIAKKLGVSVRELLPE
jgi:hypothetical protein